MVSHSIPLDVCLRGASKYFVRSFPTRGNDPMWFIFCNHQVGRIPESYVSLLEGTTLRIQVCPKKGIIYPYIPILRMGLEPRVIYFVGHWVAVRSSPSPKCRQADWAASRFAQGDILRCCCRIQWKSMEADISKENKSRGLVMCTLVFGT